MYLEELSIMDIVNLIAIANPLSIIIYAILIGDLGELIGSVSFRIWLIITLILLFTSTLFFIL